MKKIIITGFILAASMLLIPFFFNKKEQTAAPAGSVPVQASAQVRDVAAGEDTPESFRIKTGDGIITLTAEDYITGVVAAEMPVSYGKEALKAQAVAAYSFALYKKEHRSGEYDLTDSYKTDQSYLSDAALKEKLGDSFKEVAIPVRAAVREVAGEYLSFNGKPALALYHSVSPGKTNPCADVFGSKLSYLVSVNSKSDMLSPDYKSTVTLSESELKEKLPLTGGSAAGGSFSGIKKGKSGVVKQIKVAGESVSGVKLAGLLGLPSPNFTVKYSSGEYTFSCTGHGHGVGLSQYGAGRMAADGATYREILAHYYPGTEMEKN